MNTEWRYVAIENDWSGTRVCARCGDVQDPDPSVSDSKCPNDANYEHDWRRCTFERLPVRPVDPQ